MGRGGITRGLLVVMLAGAGCASTSGDMVDTPDLAGLSLQDLGPRTDLPDLNGTKADLAAAGDMAVTAGGSCNPANETLGAQGGPDSCAYGQVCNPVTSKCVPAQVGTCPMASGAPAWIKATKMAPVIIKATGVLVASTNAATECLNGDPAALITVDFYAPQNLTSKDVALSFLPQVKWKKGTLATDTWYSGTFARMLPPKNSKFGSFQVGINCGGAAGLARTAGFYISDEGARVSNAVCVTW